MIDDLQWVDDATSRVVEQLVPEAGAPPLVLVAAAREAAPGLPSVLARAADVELLRPPPLSRTTVVTLLRRRLGADVDPGFADWCVEVTAGNPFRLQRLVEGLAARRLAPREGSLAAASRLASAGVRETVRDALAELGPVAERVAGALVVLGDAGDIATVAELAGCTRSVAADAVDGLRARGLATEGDPPQVHPLVEDGIRAVIGSERLCALHARAATVLSALEASPMRVAGHILETPPGSVPDAAATLIEAIRWAVSSGAPEAAAAFARRGLRERVSEHVRTELRLALGEALQQRGDAHGVAILRRALRSAPRGTALHGRCAGSLYLDAYARWLRDTGVPAVSINWDGWRDVGAAARGTPRCGCRHQGHHQAARA